MAKNNIIIYIFFPYNIKSYDIDIYHNIHLVLMWKDNLSTYLFIWE